MTKLKSTTLPPARSGANVAILSSGVRRNVVREALAVRDVGEVDRRVGRSIEAGQGARALLAAAPDLVSHFAVPDSSHTLQPSPAPSS
jgi:hypothetical protein